MREKIRAHISASGMLIGLLYEISDQFDRFGASRSNADDKRGILLIIRLLQVHAVENLQLIGAGSRN